MSEQGLREQDAHFLAALQLAHLAVMEGFWDIQSIQQHGRIRLSGIAVFFSHDAFQFTEPHTVGVREVVFLVELLALFQRLPERQVAHDDGIDDTEFVERVLILAQNPELLGPDDACPFEARVRPITVS